MYFVAFHNRWSIYLPLGFRRLIKLHGEKMQGGEDVDK